MARIRKWQETLMLVSVALFFSLAQVWPLRARDTAGRDHAAFSRMITGTSQKTALGLELMAQKPYVRLVRASSLPVAMPLTAGAFVAMAGSPGAAAAPAAEDASSCGATCHTATAPCCTGGNGACCDPNCEECWTVRCTGSDQFRTGGYTCVTCG